MFAVPKEIITLCQVIYGFPLKYVASWELNSYVKFSRTSFLWGMTVITFQTVMSFLAVCEDFEQIQQGKQIKMGGSTAFVANLVDVVTLNLMAIVVFCSSTRQYARFVELCSVLAKVDEMLPRKLIEPRLRTKLVLILTYAAGIIAVSIYLESACFLERNGYNGYVIYYPAYSLYFSQVALFIQFTRITYAIARRFREVSKMIKEEIIKESCKRNLYFCLPDINIMSGGSSSTYKIRTLIELYWLLCEAVHHANSFYSCQLLVAVFSSFIHIVITLYYFFLHIWPTIDPEEVLYLIMQGLWVVTHITHLVLLIWPSTAVTEAADETAPMICRLMNRDLNPEIKKQLETFLLQLLHHNARFSALGFFQIHSHILTSMAGSVTTYLVILIQFQTSPVPIAKVHSSPDVNNTPV